MGDTQTSASVPRPNSQRFHGQRAIGSAVGSERTSRVRPARRRRAAARSDSTWSRVCHAWTTSKSPRATKLASAWVSGPSRHGDTPRARVKRHPGGTPAATDRSHRLTVSPGGGAGHARSTAKPRARCARMSSSIGAAGPVHFQSLVTWRTLTARGHSQLRLREGRRRAAPARRHSRTSRVREMRSPRRRQSPRSRRESPD